jgi:hypothetical protein
MKTDSAARELVLRVTGFIEEIKTPNLDALAAAGARLEALHPAHVFANPL